VDGALIGGASLDAGTTWRLPTRLSQQVLGQALGHWQSDRQAATTAGLFGRTFDAGYSTGYFMEILLRVFQVFLALGLIGVVLLQRSEGGGLGIGSSGGMGSFMSVRVRPTF